MPFSHQVRLTMFPIHTPQSWWTLRAMYGNLRPSLLRPRIRHHRLLRPLLPVGSTDPVSSDEEPESYELTDALRRFSIGLRASDILVNLAE